MPKLSACCNLAIVKHILQSFDSNSHTDVIYTGLSKTFDCVNHEVLFEKL